MKNQNDLIVIGVCVVFAIGGALTLFFMKREPVALAPPSSVVTADPSFSKDTDPAMGDSLPGGGGGGAGGFGGGFSGGFRGGAPGGMGGAPMGGPPGGMMGGGGPGSPMANAGSGGPPARPNKPVLKPSSGH